MERTGNFCHDAHDLGFNLGTDVLSEKPRELRAHSFPFNVQPGYTPHAFLIFLRCELKSPFISAWIPLHRSGSGLSAESVGEVTSGSTGGVGRERVKGGNHTGCILDWMTSVGNWAHSLLGTAWITPQRFLTEQ